MKLTILASLIFATAVLVAEYSVGFGPRHAEATEHEQLQNNVNAMNLLIAKDILLWGNQYNSLRVTDAYQWMDWGQDGCSVPDYIDVMLTRTYNVKFHDACYKGGMD